MSAECYVLFAHLCETAAVKSIVLGLWRRFLANSADCKRKAIMRSVTSYLAYAAFHCSSLRCLAKSISDWDSKREPTAPEDIDGITESSIAESI